MAAGRHPDEWAMSPCASTRYEGDQTVSRSHRVVFAYIDPGAGSLVIQAIIAGALSVPFFFRQKLSRIFRRRR